MSTHIDLALLLIKEAEGFSPHPYRCTANKLTQGYGRNLEVLPLTDKEKLELLPNGDVSEEIAEIWAIEELTNCESRLNNNIIYDRLSEVRKAVILDMCFNLGYSGLMKFKKMWYALENNNFIEAAKEMMDSSWYRQVGTRGKRNVAIMTSNNIIRKE